MQLNWMIVVSYLVPCAAVAFVLWQAFGHVESGGTKVMIAAGSVVLGLLLFFVVQSVWEGMFPAFRIGGHIVVYEIYPFIALLIVLDVAIFVMRGTSRGAARDF